jgi:solute carrier family 25 phosphate transporter 23/24/25/41
VKVREGGKRKGGKVSTMAGHNNDAIVAMTISQAVLAPPLLERPEDKVEPPPTPVQRVDFPPPEDETEETDDETRGPATAWLKENQLMLTYFLAGESIARRERYVSADTPFCVTGGMAGAASRTVVSPLERLKIILQVPPST